MKTHALILLCAAAAAPPAAAEDRVRVILNGVWNAASPAFDETRSFTEFAETGRFNARYETGSSFGFDGGVQVSVLKRLGVLLSYSTSSRDETGSFDASLPHPLYLGRPRNVSGELSGFDYKENAIHADLAIGGSSNHLDYAVFAGVSFFKVEADILDGVRYTHSYPYDTVTLTAPSPKRAEDSPTGFNLGARLDYRFGQSRRFGVGAQARFSAATAKLETSGTDTIDVDAGGFAVGAGIRIYF